MIEETAKLSITRKHHLVEVLLTSFEHDLHFFGVNTRAEVLRKFEFLVIDAVSTDMLGDALTELFRHDLNVRNVSGVIASSFPTTDTSYLAVASFFEPRLIPILARNKSAVSPIELFVLFLFEGLF